MVVLSIKLLQNFRATAKLRNRSHVNVFKTWKKMVRNIQTSNRKKTTKSRCRLLRFVSSGTSSRYEKSSRDRFRGFYDQNILATLHTFIVAGLLIRVQLLFALCILISLFTLVYTGVKCNENSVRVKFPMRTSLHRRAKSHSWSLATPRITWDTHCTLKNTHGTEGAKEKDRNRAREECGKDAGCVLDRETRTE